jgi:hypothetical protein
VTTTTTNAISNGSAQFNGVNTSKLNSTYSATELGNNFSIGGFFFIPSLTTGTIPRQMAFEAENNFEVSFGMSGSVAAPVSTVTFNSYINQTALTSTPVSLGSWVYLMQVVTNANATDGVSGQVRTYINGSLTLTQTNSGTSTVDFSGLNFGNAREGFATRGLTGQLDELVIYNRALTPAEIAAIPEPTVALLSGLGALALLRRRR